MNKTHFHILITTMLYQVLFQQLFVAQCFLVGVGFPIRPFSSILLARQSFEFNYLVSAASILFAIGLAWLGFRAGFGLWSLLAGNLLQLISSSAASLLGVRSLGYFPFFFHLFLFSPFVPFFKKKLQLRYTVEM